MRTDVASTAEPARVQAEAAVSGPAVFEIAFRTTGAVARGLGAVLLFDAPTVPVLRIGLISNGAGGRTSVGGDGVRGTGKRGNGVGLQESLQAGARLSDVFRA